MAQEKYKVMICDSMAREAVEIFERCDQIDVDVKEGQSEEDLLQSVPAYHALAVRSATKVTARVIEAAKNLRVVGRAGVGIDNVDVDMANRKGVIVMNTPEGNTISTAEHAMSMMLALSRNIPQAVGAMRDGRWDRKKFMGAEVYGKTLGIIGLGRIGSQVALRAQSFGMKVIGFDPFTTEEQAKKKGIELVPLDEVLERSDYITLHTPMTNETKGIIGRDSIKKMKPTVRIINCARGGLVDETALADALEEGRIAGAALDVYSQEPLPPESPLLKYDNCITTPHLGASTEEAQTNVAIQVAEQIRDALLGFEVRNAINMPYVPPEAMSAIGPYIGLAEKLGRLCIQLVEEQAVNKVEIVYSGELTDYDLDPLNRSVMKGILTPICEETVNFINAPTIIRDRGVLVSETKSDSSEGYRNLITVKVTGGEKSTSVSGTIFRKDPRVVRIDDYHVDAKPEGPMLIVKNQDLPGMVGTVGTVLGEAGINIADMSLGRQAKGTYAVTLINVDTEVPMEVVNKLRAHEAVISVQRADVG